METYSIKCHCGNIHAKFQREKGRPLTVWDCNCSDCRLRRNLHFMVPACDFWLADEDDDAVVDGGEGNNKNGDDGNNEVKREDDNISIQTSESIQEDIAKINGTISAKLKFQRESILYQWGTKTAIRRFCRTCGILPFYIPRSNPDGFAVTFPCVVEWVEGMETVEVETKKFDGVHWEESHKMTGIAKETSSFTVFSSSDDAN